MDENTNDVVLIEEDSADLSKDQVQAAEVTQPPPKKKKKFQNDRYNNAYGNYSGGYGPPSGGYGLPGNGFGPPGGGFGPPGGGFGPPGGGYGRRGGGYGPSSHGYGPADGFGPSDDAFGPPGGGFGPGGRRNFGRPYNYGPPYSSGPPEPQDGAYMWGRGFGPGGPPNMRRQPMADRTIKYLMRCGISKDNLKNLSWDMLQLMEPEYCGLCGHSFDSFDSSRIHYVSKNHAKIQKKWLNQQSDGEYHHSKQVALRSRELYCELCDVQITSKHHSDSHYAGKPHRSIVQGRKNPRNPFLLQHGMEDRVNQLIRREKKHLKAVAEDDETKVKETKPVKPAQPELYCEICKTSVTCTEQMTMHLNGKRHLSKEKQHILTMMKGTAADSEFQEQNEDMEVGENENENENGGEGEGEEKEASAEENFDWGNGGGGTWDELKKDDEY